MTKQYDVFTIGETMVRLVPPQNLRLGQSHQLDVTFGGAETNVASNLALLGRKTVWYSRLPEHPLSHQLLHTMRGLGVNIERVSLVADERLGLYFVEYGDTPRGIRVWYDRENSAASRMTPDDLPIDLLQQAKWFYLTGITPALSLSCRMLVEFAFQQAELYEVPIFFDVNYRNLLWEAEEAASTLEPFCDAAQVVLIALRDADTLFGVQGTSAEVVETLQQRWGGIVIVTCGADSPVACDGTETVEVAPYKTTIVDRIGAGDAFASGVLDQILDNASLKDCLQQGAALAALKLSIYGDIARVSRDEIAEVISQGSASMKR